MARTFTIRADGPDGRVDHFYADTDLHELRVVPLDALREALEITGCVRYMDFATQEAATEFVKWEERTMALLRRSATAESEDS